MTRMRPSSGVRRVILGLAVAFGLAASVEAYSSARNANCWVQCGSCQIVARECDSCSIGFMQDGCYIDSVGCESLDCQCGGFDGWECFYFET